MDQHETIRPCCISSSFIPDIEFACVCISVLVIVSAFLVLDFFLTLWHFKYWENLLAWPASGSTDVFCACSMACTELLAARQSNRDSIESVDDLKLTLISLCCDSQHILK